MHLSWFCKSNTQGGIFNPPRANLSAATARVSPKDTLIHMHDDNMHIHIYDVTGLLILFCFKRIQHKNDYISATTAVHTGSPSISLTVD